MKLDRFLKKFKKKPKEFIILTLFTIFVWDVLWMPFGVILNFNFEQWVIWVTASIPYDFALGYVSSKIIIKFDETAKKSKWY
ncbi:hypothetical protein EPN87_04165 [archaeon]|nr:MAG: hypothetical protein EPN87_04165 [archaeon]